MDLIAPSALERPALGKMFPMHYLHDEEKLARGLPDVKRAIDNIRRYSKLGAYLLKWAEENKVGFQLADDLELSTVAQCANNTAGVGENRRRSNLRFNRQIDIDDEYSLERIIAHELMHAIQHVEYNLLLPPMDSALDDYIMSTLCAEAAAETMSSVVCFEMAANGYEQPFECLLDAGRLDRHYHTVHRHFGKAYNAISEMMGDQLSAADILRAASSEAFHCYLNTPGVVRGYAASCIERYIHCITAGVFDNCPIGEDVLEAEGAKDYSRLNDDFCLVDEVKLLDGYDGIFGGNKRMRQFAQALDYHRNCRSLGVEEMQDIRMLLEGDDNPYLDMDLEQFWEEAKPRLQALDNQSKGVHQAKEIAIVRIASAYVKLDEVFQLHLPFDKNDEHAPNHEAQARIRAQSMPRVMR